MSNPRRIIIALFLLAAVLLGSCWLPAGGLRSVAYNFVRERAKTAFANSMEEYETRESEHFSVRFAPGDDASGNLVLATAESVFGPVTSDLGYTPREKTLIVIYPDREELNRSFGWSSQESAMGVYWAGAIRILDPDVWIKERDPDRVASAFRTYGPMAHEFTHLVLDYITSGNYPRWFTEGLAQYEEVKIMGDEAITLNTPQSDAVYTLGELERDFDRLSDQDAAYRQAYLLVSDFVGKYGEDGLAAVIAELADGSTWPEAVARVTGQPYQGFEAQAQILFFGK